MRTLLALLFASSVVAPAAGPSPAPSGTPAPAPVMRRMTPATPTPIPSPSGLPHYLGLGPWEQAQLDRLLAELVAAEADLAKAQVASAHVVLARARREADSAQRQLLVLPLYPAWTDARLRLDEDDAKVKSSWAKGPDPESKALVAAASRRMEALIAPMERGAAKDEAIATARQALDHENAEPRFQDNPAWQAPLLALTRRLDRLAQREALRAGESILLDEIARMSELDASARAKLAREDFDGALGDYEALEEACLTFKADLASLEARGFDPASIRYAGMEGDRQGRNFLARVDHWLLDAHRRNDLVAQARDPWRRTLTGDRLRVYDMYGLPTWPGAPETPDVQTALGQDLWIFYETPAARTHIRLRHEYHFVGDHLQHHELFQEAR